MVIKADTGIRGVQMGNEKEYSELRVERGRASTW
jgi:hypothetical protein